MKVNHVHALPLLVSLLLFSAVPARAADGGPLTNQGKSPEQQGQGQISQHSLIEQRNLNVVFKMHQDFMKGDIASLMQSLAPEVDWQVFGPEETIPFAGLYKGTQGVEQFFHRLGAEQELIDMNFDRPMVDQSMVLIQGLFTFKVKSTGRIYSSPFAHIFNLNLEGKVLKFRGFFDTAAGVAAFTK